MSQYPACFYRVSVKGIILDGGKILLAQEGPTERWDLPGGGIEHLEEIDAAFSREIQEELGVSARILENNMALPWITYDHDPGWEKPILYLVFRAVLDGMPSNVGDIRIKYFTKKELETVKLEKHIERFREQLIETAFGKKR